MCEHAETYRVQALAAACARVIVLVGADDADWDVIDKAPIVTAALARPDQAPAGYAPAPAYPDEAPKYTYSYSVQDDYTSNNYGATENRDGYATSGSYYVALPDGRLQKVY